MSELTGRCEWYRKPIEGWADVCPEHAMTNDQYGEMMRRVKAAMHEYQVELWGERPLREEAHGG